MPEPLPLGLDPAEGPVLEGVAVGEGGEDRPAWRAAHKPADAALLQGKGLKQKCISLRKIALKNFQNFPL